MNRPRQSLLVIDNEPHMLKLIERIISEKTDYEAMAIGNPLEVMPILHNQTFDVIVTDLKMPGLDGMELLREIKAQQRSEKVIIITAFATLETITKALELGAFDYLVKPFKREAFLNSLTCAMAAQKSQKKAVLLEALMTTEPYADARLKFEAEYIRLAKERYGGDAAAASLKTGLSLERFTEDTPTNQSE